jgi:hypothetical protein
MSEGLRIPSTDERPMEVLGTPDDPLAKLADLSFEPHYVEVPAPRGGRLRIHFVTFEAGVGNFAIEERPAEVCERLLDPIRG